MCLRPLLCSMPILFLLWHLSTSATRSLHSIPLFLCQLLPVKFPIYGFLEGPAVSARFVWLISWHKHCSVRISYCIVYRTAKLSLSKAGASTQWAVNPWSFTRQYRIPTKVTLAAVWYGVRKGSHTPPIDLPQWRLKSMTRILTTRPQESSPHHKPTEIQATKEAAPDQRKKAVPQSEYDSPWLPHTFLENSSSKRVLHL